MPALRALPVATALASLATIALLTAVLGWVALLGCHLARSEAL